LESNKVELSKTKAHTMPKGVVNLENLFYLQNKFKLSSNVNTNISTSCLNMINLETKENPKNLNIGIGCFEQEKQYYIKVFRTYQEVFAWTYNYISKHMIYASSNIQYT
jgi:hypothetical protein